MDLSMHVLRNRLFLVMGVLVIVLCACDVTAMESVHRDDPRAINQQLRIKLRGVVDLRDRFVQHRVRVSMGPEVLMHVSLPGSVDDHQAPQQCAPASTQTIDQLRGLLAKPGYILHWLAYFGYDDAFRFIIDQNLLTDAQLATLLNLPLVMADRPDALEHDLAESRVAQSETGMRPLHLAIYCQKNQLVPMFLQHGAFLEVRTQLQRTPLHLAVRLGYHALARMLLERGADSNVQAPDENVTHLVERNITRHEQMTPLFYAAAHGDVEMVKLLLEFGARVVATRDLGETPLHHAVAYDREEVVRCLLDHGADTRACIQFRIRQSRGVVASRSITAADLARELHYDRLVPLLQPRIIAKPCCLIL